MLGQSARSIWRTCKRFLTIETGCMDPTNIIMFLLVFCVTGAMAVDPQAQKNQWNVLSGGCGCCCRCWPWVVLKHTGYEG